MLFVEILLVIQISTNVRLRLVRTMERVLMELTNMHAFAWLAIQETSAKSVNGFTQCTLLVE